MDDKNHVVTLKIQRDNDIGTIESEIPSSCAICLDNFEEGDTVVWSKTQRCPDVFHEDCILRWLIDKEDTLCPCCRLEFVDGKVNHVRSEVSLSNSNVHATTLGGQEGINV